MELITQMELLDETNFLIWYDDLGGAMTSAFINNFLTLQQKYPFLKESNMGLVRARGWLGVNEGHHLNGLIGSMNIQNLIHHIANL